jgi:hypothetical protein
MSRDTVTFGRLAATEQTIRRHAPCDPNPNFHIRGHIYPCVRTNCWSAAANNCDEVAQFYGTAPSCRLALTCGCEVFSAGAGRDTSCPDSNSACPHFLHTNNRIAIEIETQPFPSLTHTYAPSTVIQLC